MLNLLSLDEIAIKHGTDKSSLHHNYTRIYDDLFSGSRSNFLTLFECGYGSYWKENEGGHGARMWREYFERAEIITTDIYHKTNIPDHVHFYQGSQDDKVFWDRIIGIHGRPDIFIDDASHINSLTVETMRIMLPQVNPGGWYVIEDAHTSYWRDIASDGTDFKGGLGRSGSIIECVKDLIDNVNHIHSDLPDYGIQQIRFYEKMIFIQKK